MPYGRGGAGNILQAKEDSKKIVEVTAHYRASMPAHRPATSAT
jgi:hypothetical protein